MTFTKIEFTKPLLEFLQKFPLLPDGTVIAPMTYSPDMILSGGALAYNGTARPQITQDVEGNIFITKQANFLFYIRRPTLDERFKLDTADFLYNFESWVEFENLFGNPPRFGHPDFNERIWADNGSYWSEAETPGTTDYMIQLHIEYQLKYESEDFD